jgi:hypothetical protein
MIVSAATYHSNLTTSKAGRLATLTRRSEVTVVVFCENASSEDVASTVNSIARQTVGNFTIVLVNENRVGQGTWLDEASGADRVRLITALEADDEQFAEKLLSIRTPYFSVVQAGDRWFSTHVESLLADLDGRLDDMDIRYGGSLMMNDEDQSIVKPLLRRRIHNFGPRLYAGHSEDDPPGHGFIASSRILEIVLKTNRSFFGAGISKANEVIYAVGNPSFSYSAAQVMANLET